MTSLPTDADDPRLAALAKYDILDTPRELAFDRITGLVKKIFGVPMSTISFIDGHRQWFKASEGMADRETSRGPALCYYAIQQSTPLLIEDTSLDARFRDNAFVLGKPYLRAYAGVQLTTEGVNIGTLCAMDTAPRRFSPEQVGILADLAGIVMDELELRNVAMRDNLTGTLSRRAFRSEADRIVSLAQRHGHNVTCAVLDFDHFKAVNDAHGHGVGDLALVGVMDICQRKLRKSDVIGRIGGEEFAILLPHTDLAAAMEVIEKVRMAIAASSIETPCGPLRVTCSFGIAALGESRHDIDELLRCADSALYSAKAAGRNRAIVWVDAPPINGIARRRVLKAGQIAFNAGRSTVDCTVRSLSEHSATIDVISTADLPSKFKLNIEAGSLSRACRIISRSETRIEVEFA
jgi:diguanylate cyclase (GGDEF)-like protein